MGVQLTLEGKPIQISRREKFTVVFEAETVKHPRYPEYEEKLLYYDGKPIPYKAIVYKGKLVAIVSRQYKLVPHEEVIEAVKKKAGDKINEIMRNTRRLYIWLDYGEFIVLIRNAIDGSLSLRADSVFKIDGIPSYFGNVLYRKHVGTVENWVREQLPEIVKETEKTHKKFKMWLTQLKTIPVKREHIEALRNVLPQKYIRGAILQESLRDVYTMVLRRIWSTRDCSIERKIELNKMLNNLMFLWVEFKK